MQDKATQDIPPIAMPGTHQKFLPYFLKNVKNNKSKVLDIGAGYGAFSQKLHRLGFQPEACDLFPKNFRYAPVQCKYANIMESLPYEEKSFDVAVAIEVVEHINDHEILFKECARVLKPGGSLFISTPNILSWKSRIRFLFSGYFYSFQALELKNFDGLQHVSSLTLDQYNYIALKFGFDKAKLEVDKYQKSSRWLMFLYPLGWFYCKLKKLGDAHNRRKLLLGRLLFMEFKLSSEQI
jgi:SAM-dependent methyltransferase